MPIYQMPYWVIIRLTHLSASPIIKMAGLYRISICIITLLLLAPGFPQCTSVPNCLHCPTGSTCIQCAPSYSLVGTGCVGPQSKTQQDNRNKFVDGDGGNLRTQPVLAQGKGRFLQGLIRFGAAGYAESGKCMLEWKGVCLICGKGYEMGMGGVCLERLDECVRFQGLLCVECDGRFSLQQGQCMDLGCQTSNYYHCSTCLAGYRLSQYQHCQVQLCLSYQNGKCSQCAPNAVLANGTCTTMTPNCKSYTVGGCQQCNGGYLLVDKICKLQSASCKTYDRKSGQCLECKYQELSLVKGACVDKNCISAEDNYGLCLACGIGYQLTDNRVCVPVFKDQRCLRVNFNSCIKCEEGYFVGKEGRCVALPPNCIEATCKYCKKGFISYGGGCQALSNCAKVSGNICLLCQPGYSLTVLGTCTKTIPNCMEYSFTGCSKCPPNYNLGASGCTVNPSFSDPNCNARNYKNECILCKARYRLSTKYNNLCLVANTQCKTANSDGECLSCYQGYKLNELIGDCVQVMAVQNCAQQVEGQCLKCANRYYLVNSMTCKEVDSLCKDYEKELGYCLSCYEGYYLAGNLCEPINSLFIAPPSSPQPRPIPPTPPKSAANNCRTPDSKNSSRCQQCYDSYYVEASTGNCLKANTQCKTFDPASGACLSCYDGYKLSDRDCLTDQDIHLENCLEPSETDPLVCRKCLEGYYVKEKKCEKTSILCSTSNEQGECIKCIEGYFKNEQGKCIMPALGWDANCTRYSSEGYCLQCVGGMRLENFLCV